MPVEDDLTPSEPAVTTSTGPVTEIPDPKDGYDVDAAETIAEITSGEFDLDVVSLLDGDLSGLDW